MSKINKIVVFILVISFLFSPIFSRPIQAQGWPVYDNANFFTNLSTQIKDYGLDAAAWAIANLIIERMAASTVNWINTGFKGKPAYVTDPEAYFTDIGDKIAGQYIFSDPNLNFLCGPISAKVRLALTTNYVRDDRIWRCTLTDVVDNVDDFMDDFSKGGWDGFFELTQKPQNNPMGGYLQAENEMYLQIATRQGTKKTELDWGNGFMSFEVCGPEGKDEDGTCIGRAEIATPGSVIQNQLNKTLGTGGDKLAVADEINEIVSALLNQMISQVVGGIGRGLRGLSSGGSDSEKPFTSQLSGSTAAGVTDYFGNVQDTSVMDVPLPDYNQNQNQTCNPFTDPSCTAAP